MIENDTIRLLRECDAGIKMGLSSFDEVMKHISSDRLKGCVSRCRNQHNDFAEQTEKLLSSYSDSGKEPNPIAKGMSWLKTNVMLSVNESDAVIADLMTDGCNMGVKSLSRYLNEYKAADEKSKEIAKKIIESESALAGELRAFL